MIAQQFSDALRSSLGLPLPEKSSKAKLDAIIRREGVFLTDHPMIALSTVTLAFLSLAVPIMTLQVYDRVLTNPQGGTLPILMAGVMTAIFMDFFLKLARNYIIASAGAIFEHKMNCRTFEQILLADHARKKSFDPGEELQRLQCVNEVKSLYTGPFFLAVCETVLLPIFLVLLLYIGGWLTLVPIAVVSAYVFFALRIGEEMKKAVEERDEIDDARYSYLVNTLRGVHTIKAFAIEKLFERQYEYYKENVGIANFKVAEASARLSNLGTTFSSIMLVATVTIGAFMVLQTSITMGALIAAIVISGRIMQPVQKIVNTIVKLKDTEKSRDDLLDILSMPVIDKADAVKQAEEENARLGTIRLENMSFCYPSETESLFENVNLYIPAGQTISISGGFGSGKTTLLHLLAGIFEPTSGNIDIDGNQAWEIPQDKVAEYIGLLENEGTLFRGSIRDNITRFGLTPENKGKEITALLGMDEDIAKLPAGYDTQITGSHIDKLQPGLKQRIAIARALATKPKIILFDQADRDLDHKSYASLFKALAKIKGSATLIIVSNDENLNSLADIRYLIKDKALIPLE